MRKRPLLLVGRQGFTLTEMLVGAVCLAALMLLGLAAISPAMRASRDSKCISNLRQLHQATISYANDRNGYLPSYRPDQSTKHKTNPGIAEYLGLNGAEYYSNGDYRETVFTCPAIQATEKRSGRPYFLSYGINGRATVGQGVSESLRLMRVINIENPSLLMLFMEASVNETMGGSTRPPGINFNTHVNWALVSMLLAPHRDKQHAIFFDGHVSAVAISEIPEGSSNHNEPFWSGKTKL